jgi:GT2 family glycosyltransferase
MTDDTIARFSVVVPTRRRPAALRRCLESLAQLEYPVDAHEVVVVDDGGGLDGELVASSGGNVRFLEQAPAGPARARNRGATAASAPYLAFVDDDCVVDSGWLHALGVELRARPEAAIGGCVVNDLPENACATATQMLIDYVNRWYASNRPERQFATSNNLAVSRARFLELGGFDERFELPAAEDRDFAARWAAAGRELVSAPAAVVRHAHDLTLARFLRQHFNYGRGSHALRSPESADVAGFEPLGFYFRLVTEPLGQQGLARRRALVLVALLALSQAATALGFVYEATRSRQGASTSFRARKPSA